MAIGKGPGYNFSNSNNQSSLSIDGEFRDWYDGTTQHPFKVFNVTYDAAGSAWLFQVVPGTLNNEVAQIDEDGVWVLLNRTSGGLPDWPVSVLTPFDSTTHKCYIYLRAGVDATSNKFPGEDDTANEYPRIICSDVELSDTDTYGYVLLAVATEGTGPVCSVVQYVTGSLWADRLKTGTDTARYYYAGI